MLQERRLAGILRRTEVSEMFLAMAALLIHPQLAAQIPVSAEKVALIQPADADWSASAAGTPEKTLPLSAATIAEPVQPAVMSDAATLPEAPLPIPAVSAPVPYAFLRPGKPMTVSVKALREEDRRNRRIWLGLGIAEHSAATFDAWSTRHAITTAGAQELNPLLKPFAGNASLYAAIQVAPLVMDFAARKMMYSRHSWLRH